MGVGMGMQQKQVLGFPQLISGKDFDLKKLLDADDSNHRMYAELMHKHNKKTIMTLEPSGELL